MAAKKKSNGHDTVTERMVQVLERIEKRLDALEGIETGVRVLQTEMKGVNIRLDKTNERLDTLHEDVIALSAKGTSLGNEVRGYRIEAMADLDEVKARLAKIEAVVFRDAAE